MLLDYIEGNHSFLESLSSTLTHIVMVQSWAYRRLVHVDVAAVNVDP